VARPGSAAQLTKDVGSEPGDHRDPLSVRSSYDVIASLGLGSIHREICGAHGGERHTLTPTVRSAPFLWSIRAINRWPPRIPRSPQFYSRFIVAIHAGAPRSSWNLV
jgi:hypothetical protein